MEHAGCAVKTRWMLSRQDSENSNGIQQSGLGDFNLKEVLIMHDENRNQGNGGRGIARVGAICYVFWGLVHYQAAYGVFSLASKLPASMVRGRINQDAFYLACFATTGIIVGILLNWRNDRLGFWVNAIVISAGDIPFILFVLLPGYIAFWPGVLGPVLWIAALICTGLGRSLSVRDRPYGRLLANRAGLEP